MNEKQKAERIKELVNGALIAHEQDEILLSLVLEKFAELIWNEAYRTGYTVGRCDALCDIHNEVYNNGYNDGLQKQFVNT